MDMMRTDGGDDEEEEGRKINHHGKTISVGSDGRAISKPKEAEESGIDMVSKESCLIPYILLILGQYQ